MAQPTDREQRLAAKLRENLRRRKAQARARAETSGQPESATPDHPEQPDTPVAGRKLKPTSGSDS